MANTKPIKNLNQFYGFMGEAFTKDKDFVVTDDPMLETEWEDGKSTDKVKDIKVYTQVEHDNTKYVDSNGVPVDVNNRRYPVVFKFKLPANIVGKSEDDEQVQKYLGAFNLHTDELIKIKHASYYFSPKLGLYVTIENIQDVEVVGQV